MAAANGMHGSEALQNDIFGDSPRMVGLWKEIRAMLLQFSPEQNFSPEASKIIGRIDTIAKTIDSQVKTTRDKLTGLYIETIKQQQDIPVYQSQLVQNHLSKYKSEVDKLEDIQRARVAEVLMMAA